MAAAQAAELPLLPQSRTTRAWIFVSIDLLNMLRGQVRNVQRVLVPLSDHAMRDVKILARGRAPSSCAGRLGCEPVVWRLLRVALLARFDAVEEYAHHFPVERILEHAVFVPGVDIGIIIDFDDITAAIHLFDVHAVKPSPMRLADLSAILITSFGASSTGTASVAPRSAFAAAHRVSRPANVLRGNNIWRRTVRAGRVCHPPVEPGRQPFLGDDQR